MTHTRMNLRCLEQGESQYFVRVSQPNDVGNFMRFLMEMAEKSSIDERLEMIKSPRIFRHMQYLQFFIHYHCDNCTRHCPGTS